jgi:hypothetical protein
VPIVCQDAKNQPLGSCSSRYVGSLQLVPSALRRGVRNHTGSTRVRPGERLGLQASHFLVMVLRRSYSGRFILRRNALNRVSPSRPFSRKSDLT